jgi:23S rRNA (guanosine2251-2'-O)-methyltransferase
LFSILPLPLTPFPITPYPSMNHRKLSTTELNRLSAEEFRARDKFPIIVVLDNIRSGLNVGSIFRSADAFNVAKVVCCGITPAPPNREVLKSALGSTETVEWEYAERTLDLVERLKVEGAKVYAVEQTENSVFLTEFKCEPGVTYAFVLGNEVSGVDQSVIDSCHGALEIQQHGTKHSLNVAVCAGVVMSWVVEV